MAKTTKKTVKKQNVFIVIRTWDDGHEYDVFSSMKKAESYVKKLTSKEPPEIVVKTVIN